MPPKPEPRNLEEQARKVLATRDRMKQNSRIRQLAKLAHSSPRLLSIVKFLAAPPGGPRIALRFIARLPLPVPSDVFLLAVALLAPRTAPIGVRLSAAARLIASMPDRPDSIRPIVQALNAGLGRTKSLERLIHLQSRVRKSDSLDQLVQETESRVKFRCPKCPARLSRPVLIQHLWDRHRLVYDRGRARERATLMEHAVSNYLKKESAESLDHIYHLVDQLYSSIEPIQVHQALLSRSNPSPADLEPLIRSARDAGAGVCPGCYATIRNPLASMPPPLMLQSGRLVGEGFRVEIDGRSLTVTRPGHNPSTMQDPRSRLEPRDFAVRAAASVAGVGAILSAFAPRSIINPLASAFLFSIASLLTYAAARQLRQTKGKPSVRAIDAAWEELVPFAGRSTAAVRFLTRLCRNSLGVGDHDLRSSHLLELVEHAAVLSEKRGIYMQFFAAARTLQTHDSARMGREWGSELVRLFDPFLRGELPAEYAEAAADCLLNAEPFTDQVAARVRIMLAVAAFESGLSPIDLVEFEAYLPQFSRLLAGNADWFRLLYETWRLRSTRPWDAFASAETVFEYARNSPQGSGKVLVNYPDTLFISRFDPPYDRELGLVLIGRRGVTVMERTTSDPNAPVAIEKTRNGTTVLQFGNHTIAMRKRLPEKVVRTLQGWLRFRAERLMPALDKPFSGRTDRMRQILYRLAVDCPMCGTRTILRMGELGVKITQ